MEVLLPTDRSHPPKKDACHDEPALQPCP
jgi:hypothetical protein